MMRHSKWRAGDHKVDIKVRLYFEGCSGETEFLGLKLSHVLSLVLDGLQCEVVELDLSCTQVLRVLQDADVKACAGGNLADRPAKIPDQQLRATMVCCDSPQQRGGSSLTLPVLVDEALVLCVRIDGRQS